MRYCRCHCKDHVNARNQGHSHKADNLRALTYVLMHPISAACCKSRSYCPYRQGTALNAEGGSWTKSARAG